MGKILVIEEPDFLVQFIEYSWNNFVRNIKEFGSI